MTKFMVLFNSDESARERMEKSTPERVQASMNEWIAWKDEAVKSAQFEFGLPLQAIAQLTSEGSSNSHTPVSGYATMEGEKETIVELLKSHPHLKMPGASIDLLEMIPMSQMQK